MKRKKKLKKTLITLFLFICSLIFISVFSIFYVLQEQEHSGGIINISGRQRMLNQKLAKSTLLLIQSTNQNIRKIQKKEIRNELANFKSFHTSLLHGNDDLHIKADHSEEINNLFQQIQPSFEGIINITEEVLKIQIIPGTIPSQKSNFDILSVLLDNEKEFLMIMEKIVSTYEKENHERINILKLILLFTGSLLILLIILVAYLINQNIKNSLLLLQKTLVIKEQNKKLLKSSDELQQGNEKLQTLNADITLQKEYLIGINQDLAHAMQENKQQKIIESAHKKINSSLAYAKKLQEALLPEQENVSNQLKNYFVYYKPKNIVSGDFYYVNKIENTLLFTVGDCTGHSVPGAFMTMLSMTFINEIIRAKTEHNSANILEELRTRIKEVFKKASNYDKNGLDIAFCTVDTQTNILQYAGAYNPLWIIRQSELLEYKGTRAPIGNYPKHINFENTEIQLKNNDLIYLFSDGYYDQFGGESNLKFGKKAFKNLLLEIQHLQPKEQKEILDRKLQEWQMKHSQIDDITVMGIKWIC
jgi:serine phosphatase RsbU (regulator of sigma subunit)